MANDKVGNKIAINLYLHDKWSCDLFLNLKNKGNAEV